MTRAAVTRAVPARFTITTADPTGKAPAVDGTFLVPNAVESSTITVVVAPREVVRVQVDPEMLWMVPRNAMRLAGRALRPLLDPVAEPPGAAGATETDAVLEEDATMALPTPQAVSPEISTTARTAAVMPTARG